MNELMVKLLEEKDIVEELIKIDNEVMNTSYDYDYYTTLFSYVLEQGMVNKIIDQDIVFVTEGDVLITLQLLLKMGVGATRVIFINQGFVGMNKWLVTKYIEITGDNDVILDTDINYNKYIDKGYKVVPIGEDGLVDQVLEDFYV
ncbi:MAG: hypothetical protein E7171_02870 [Firmicutes bacterium]|nr:hypothetical protein [Bacillota bacterium]